MSEEVKKHYNIDEAITRLFKDFPFFARVLYHIKRQYTEEVPTLAVTIDRRLLINKKYWDTLILEEQNAALLHEVLHLALLHIPRFNSIYNEQISDKNKLANIAMDCAINQIIEKLDPYTFKLNKDWVHYKHFLKQIPDLKPMETAEYYYNKFLETAQNNPSKNGSGLDLDGKCDSESIGKSHKKMFDESKDKNNSEQVSNIEQEITKNILEEAKQVVEETARKKGTGAGFDICSVLPKYITIDKNIWKNLIHKVIGSNICENKEYVFGKPSRKNEDGIYGYRHLCESNDVYIGIDTSGSVSNEDLTKFSGVIAKALRTENVRATIIQCDWDIQKVTPNVTRIPTDVKFQFKGRGGTQLTKILDYIEENCTKRKVNLILLTDGETNWRESTKVITSVIYTHNHSKINGIKNFAVLE